MPHKLALNILDVLKKANLPKHVGEPGAWYQRVILALSKVSQVNDLLDALADLEGMISAYITLELSRYQPTIKIANQQDRSATIQALASILFKAYRLVAAKARSMVLTGDQDLKTVAARITLKKESAGNKSALQFLEEVDGFVIISLMVANRSPTGQRLVQRLAAANATVSLRVVYKESPSSLLAFTAGGGAYCQAAPVQGNPFEDPALHARAKSIAKGAGGPSELGAPVWFEEEENRSAGMLEADSFKHQSVDVALGKILMGSISFTRDKVPFFTPPRIELLHELIHVLHNARGSNREAIRVLSNVEEDAWHNAEEYWTIAGGNISENAFNATIGAPDRYGHGGLVLRGLELSSPFAQYSIQQHAGF
ncbi:hypothetical protein CYFUS_002466 [Cystobacter fuscus]|uniref:Uncharacterized protein n=1 Tax=Cystobacter fuscus TaxID=43 RepID=A0A250IZ87_9BACT|nr:hypothetical protein [Cystobacter fuscus]ATB37045.1 hypothetical protein CYFUS_002466 [Cystobacter fuscus]